MIRRIWAPTHPGHITLGLLLWCLWFVVLYSGLSVACALAPPATETGALTWLNGVLLVLTAAVIAVLAAMSWRCWKAAKVQSSGTTHRFVARLGAAAHGLAALAALWVSLPVVVLPPCL